MYVKHGCEPAVLHGGVIHWLDWDGDIILAYDIRSTKMDTLKLPPTTTELKGTQLHLGTSRDGKLLKLLAAGGLTISVWLMQPSDPASGNNGDWTLAARRDRHGGDSALARTRHCSRRRRCSH
ncbi:hypothetical protein BRADI_1g29331v3 [Brachypodium distachyon]|uniref:DUF7595 domain-containing protein n=1 Tax=Brachypodium distachyon TaxID=15368 RepID=A0A2K2DLW6_BRADI|nr:hypothetical protein BRADI_1g29331v3 [Brachypodium distachyon]